LQSVATTRFVCTGTTEVATGDIQQGLNGPENADNKKGKANMKTTIYRRTAAIELTAVLAVPAAAQNQVPFKGTMQGHDTDIGFTDTTVTVLTVGTGNGTHLGQFLFTQTTTVDLTQGSDTGSAHWVAANKDTIDTTIVGFGVPRVTPDRIVIDITEINTITGGTGRFAGAQGTFTIQRVASPVTFLTSGSFQGTITSPGAAH
jgi:hypothetical protein